MRHQVSRSRRRLTYGYQSDLEIFIIKLYDTDQT